MRAAGRAIATLSVLRSLSRVGPLPGLDSLPGLDLLTDIGTLPGLVYASPVLALRPRRLGRTIRRGRRAFLRVHRCRRHQRYGEAQEECESDWHGRVSHIGIPSPGAPGLQTKDDR